MKKITGLFLFAFGFVACGGDAPTTNNNPEKDSIIVDNSSNLPPVVQQYDQAPDSGVVMRTNAHIFRGKTESNAEIEMHLRINDSNAAVADYYDVNQANPIALKGSIDETATEKGYAFELSDGTKGNPTRKILSGHFSADMNSVSGEWNDGKGSVSPFEFKKTGTATANASRALVIRLLEDLKFSKGEPGDCSQCVMVDTVGVDKESPFLVNFRGLDINTELSFFTESRLEYKEDNKLETSTEQRRTTYQLYKKGAEHIVVRSHKGNAVEHNHGGVALGEAEYQMYSGLSVDAWRWDGSKFIQVSKELFPEGIKLSLVDELITYGGEIPNTRKQYLLSDRVCIGEDILVWNGDKFVKQ